ncbi:MAG: hypothetical protein IKM20_03730, partial [Erysipelotrichales bacterium]|nr:hypothetical protein [Erysipelotrichales bacterium]
VELFVNETSLGKKTAEDHFFYFEVPNVGESTLVAVAGECRDESKLRKVDTFNEAYRLKEKGAVLNWFDITTPEGYYSLNDKLEDLVKAPEGGAILGQLMAKMMPAKEGEENAMNDPENAGKMIQMLGSFTILRLIGLIGNMGVKPSKEDLLALNAQLNTVKKVD